MLHCLDGGEHVWEPSGTWGPYPVEECRRCRTGAICNAPGYPPALDMILGALSRAGCAPSPVQHSS